MFWATRTFSPNGWYEVQDRFEEEFDEAGQPAGMLLIYAEAPNFDMRIFIGLPSAASLTGYDGFVAVEEASIPAGRIKLLMGDPTHFDAIFRHRARDVA